MSKLRFFLLERFIVEMLKRLFGSRKWVLALSTIIIDAAVYLTLPVELATQIATFVTITSGVVILGESYIDGQSAAK